MSDLDPAVETTVQPKMGEDLGQVETTSYNTCDAAPIDTFADDLMAMTDRAKGTSQTDSAPSTGLNAADQAELSFTFGQATSQDEDSGDDVFMGNLIEQGHNLTAREDNPAKRQKLMPEDAEKKQPFAKFEGRSGGIISEHLKEKRREANESSDRTVINIEDTPEPGLESTPEVVDLTLGMSTFHYKYISANKNR